MSARIKKIAEMKKAFDKDFDHYLSTFTEKNDLSDEFDVDPSLDKSTQYFFHICFEMIFDIAYEKYKIHEDAVQANLHYLLNQR